MAISLLKVCSLGLEIDQKKDDEEIPAVSPALKVVKRAVYLM